MTAREPWADRATKRVESLEGAVLIVGVFLIALGTVTVIVAQIAQVG